MRAIKLTGYLILSLLAISCGSEERNNSQNSDDFLTISNPSEHCTNTNSNELYFKGGIIHFEEVGGQEKTYSVQEITKQSNDIKYRAKRVSNELYLKNKGVQDEDLQNALKEVEGEQLFYFEFEEKLKQDLVKKYLDENLDANIAYLSFDIYRDFKLVTLKGDTIMSNYSLYEQSFHLAPYERLIVSFSGVDPDEEVQLIYNDRLFGKGKFDFAFASTNYINNNTKNPS